MLVALGVPLLFVFVAVLAAAVQGLRINREYERAVLYRLGRLQNMRGPGLFWLIPLLDRSVKIDIRVTTVTLDTQETVSSDGVPVKVNAVLWYKIADANLAVNAVRDPHDAIVQASETALRDVIGQHDLDDLLKNRMGVNAKLMELLKRTSEKWGIHIDAVEMRDLDIPEQMQRALAREAEATREAKARLIKAEGEAAAAETLVEAARKISSVPAALELRRLQTITEIGAEHNSTVVIALPMDIASAAAKIAGAASR
jgi:regulator of protease activity HflC (stomatin/prohibitin superfamily)